MPPEETLTWERGHSLASVLWFISLSSSFKALRTVAWFHCSAGKSSSFEQLRKRARVSSRRPSAVVLAAGNTQVPYQCHSRTFRRLPREGRGAGVPSAVFLLQTSVDPSRGTPPSILTSHEICHCVVSKHQLFQSPGEMA